MWDISRRAHFIENLIFYFILVLSRILLLNAHAFHVMEIQIVASALATPFICGNPGNSRKFQNRNQIVPPRLHTS